ncbi:MAG TPA: DUF1549 and DUF1553 domain-containing protein [Pirellulales bacterium]|nr:DUF1549 and DUF1553 domain-containing protein [Pirellulales bacterium]
MPRSYSFWVLSLVALTVCCRPVQGETPTTFSHGDWPFRPPQRPSPPATNDPGWCINPIDRFVLAKLEAAGLTASPAADKLTLLRRLSFDLLGLPPTEEEQQAFLEDGRPDAYDRQVDRLLASPAFGERAAERWLDLVRYAETDGFKADELRPTAYKYRDFVIRALNDNLPYDRFVAWQLAGDELQPDSPLALAATGYNRLYPDEYNAANLEQRRQEILDDVTATTSVAFMGLTMGCAQCHDHKFDDIAQTDYFRLQAFFSPLVPRDDVPDATPEEAERYRHQLATWREATAEVRAQIDELLAAKRAQLREYGLGKFRAEIRQAVDVPAAERTPYQEQIARMALKQAEPKEADIVNKLSAEDKLRYQDLQAKLKEFDSLRPAPLPTLMAVGDVGRTAPVTWLLTGGAWHKPAEELLPGFPAFLGDTAAAVSSPGSGSASTGRRTALAGWLVRPDHPLTSRVIVNRIWQQHFGVGIVPTPNDFGGQGDAPTHRELLDWLAVELVESGWDVKHIHRLLVTSAAYRQTSRVDSSPGSKLAAERDPQNRLLWHARRRRLEGETLRDSLLCVSGAMNRRMFGASARPALPNGLSKSYAWSPDERREDRDRRSVYVLAKRNLHYPLFEAFDQPDMHHSCPRRAETTTAPQSLALLNGELAIEQARRWSERLLARHGADLTALVSTAYRQAFGRPAAEDEIATAVAFVQSRLANGQAADEAGSSAGGGRSIDNAVADFCHALINANEFLYVD